MQCELKMLPMNHMPTTTMTIESVFGLVFCLFCQLLLSLYQSYFHDLVFRLQTKKIEQLWKSLVKRGGSVRTAT